MYIYFSCFLQKMMKYEPSQRISAKTALTHSYFSGVANNRPVPYIKWTNTSQCYEWTAKNPNIHKVAIANSIKWSCVLTENVAYHICFNQWNFDVSIKTICVYTWDNFRLDVVFTCWGFEKGATVHAFSPPVKF